MQRRRSDHGFEEVPHTADWAIRVWAKDFPSLFGEAALGMNALSGAVLQAAPRVTRTFTQGARDVEGLLIAFLSELVYLQEHERLAFSDFDIGLDGSRLSVQMHGAPLASLAKPIKAVTYHNLKISRSADGFEVEIVFDV